MNFISLSIKKKKTNKQNKTHQQQQIVFDATSFPRANGVSIGASGSQYIMKFVSHDFKIWLYTTACGRPVFPC